VKALGGSMAIESIEIGGVFITPIQILIVTSSVILLGILGFCVHCTAFGRKIRAFSQHSPAAQSLGISRRRITNLVFVTGTLLAAFAGVMVGFENNIQPTMGNTYTIKAFAAMILGGLGNIWGAVAGSYLLGLIENLSIGLSFGSYSLPAGYKDAFAFSIILLVLLFRPQGLFQKKSRSA
ncbi:branched-chain amino acid ABC transporter permease, partial [bacterium]|nr:branched-chain amino acid ABC transporter permease [bacterium]